MKAVNRGGPNLMESAEGKDEDNESLTKKHIGEGNTSQTHHRLHKNINKIDESAVKRMWRGKGEVRADRCQ